MKKIKIKYQNLPNPEDILGQAFRCTAHLSTISERLDL